MRTVLPAVLTLLPLLMAGPTLAQAASLLTNGGFAEPGDGLAAGWSLELGVGTATAAREDAGGPDGRPCLAVTMPAQGQSDLRTTAGYVELKPDAAYLLTAAIRATNAAGGSHSAELQWFSETAYLARDTAAATVADRWTRVAVGPVRPPEGAKRVIVLLRCYAPGTYAFADIGLWEVGSVPPNVLANPSFESDGNGDGLPDAWEPSGEGARVDTQGARTGQLNVRAEAGAGWRQTGIPVTPATRYELVAATRGDEFGRELRLAVEWTNQQGEALGSEEFTDQTWTGWQVKTLRAVSPPNAARAAAVLQNRGAGTVWFDDVTLNGSGVLAEVSLRPEAPNARGLVRDGVDSRALKIRCDARSEETDLALRLRLIDAQGATLSEQQLPWRNGPAEWSPDIAGCAPGAYRVVAEAVRADGTPVAGDETCLDIVPADAPGLYFRPDHVALIDGRPWFPIGVTGFGPGSPEAERIVKAGFNLLVTGGFTNGEPEAVRGTLQRAEELGIHLIEWNNGHVYGNVPSAEKRRLFADSALKVAGHPRFLGWMCDEALWNGVPIADVRDGYLAARAAAPALVFWQNQAPRNSVGDLARYCRWADVTGMDIYPVEGAEHSDLPDKTLAVVGAETDKQHLTVEGRKPVWAILQGFGWSAWEADPAAHKRAPTWPETRFMAYDALLHGAVGIVYWGASYEDQESDIWQSLRRIAGEVAALSPALVADERPPLQVSEGPVVAMARRVEGKLWVIAANESEATVQATLSGLAGAARLARFQEPGDPVTVNGGAITDPFGPWEVHVYVEE